MTPAALSLAIYGVYLLANGIGLLTFPAIPLGLLGLTPPAEPWARLFGLVASELGFYFIVAARRELTDWFRATVFARFGAAAVFVLLFALGIGPGQLLIFAAIDLATALWTHFAGGRRGAASLRHQETKEFSHHDQDA